MVWIAVAEKLAWSLDSISSELVLWSSLALVTTSYPNACAGRGNSERNSRPGRLHVKVTVRALEIAMFDSTRRARDE